ncbi:GRP family sugar transporter [Clostridium beijerinckii]|uniref:Glucose uptake protein GlcU n=1 Tax=Clostridium beijerinckii TaxID=1520 RepID=A0A1S8SBA5_CLOBE|nr:GRP family sugar transporter [Clostridium beijerinckii]NRY59320.1 glucose uptake protein [Clostridium beijerinckii]OOM62634.1 glucose uptake protein GlcU [Clostridium beijerinckii]
MSVIIYLLPALGWGLMPIFASKAGGNPKQQLLGTTIIAFLVGVVFSIIAKPTYTGQGFLISCISGVFWTFGQLFQFKALKEAPVSQGMPVSNGTQLLFTTLVSGVILGEWASGKQTILSLIALGLIIFAIWLLANKGEKKQTFDCKSGNNGWIISMIISSLFLTGYVTTNAYFKISNFEIFFPQSLGMISTALIMYITSNKEEKSGFKNAIRNCITGLSWSIANISIFFTASHLGVGLSYTISQLCVFVSIFAGIIILGEKKTSVEKKRISLGVTIFLFSIVILSVYK